jgi:hypothetical protein
VTGQRQHGTRACYVFGPGPGAGPGCRCQACTTANRAANHHRARMILYGRWQPWTDAEPVRQHLADLRAAGLGRRRIAALAGVSDSTVTGLLYGKPGRPPARRIRPETARKLLAVQAGPAALAAKAPVTACGTHRRLQALIAIGHTQTSLATRLGMTPSNFGAMLRREQVTAATARAVRQLYDQLWDRPPTPQDPRAKAAATLARGYAAARGWAPPLAWDDDTLDDPAAKPAPGWRPARRLRPAAALAADAAELITSQGHTREQAAARLGVTPAAITKAFTRTRQTPHQQEGPAVMLTDPGTIWPQTVPVKPASEYQQGAAFGVAMFGRQLDAGLTADQLAERHRAAAIALTRAAHTDSERQFLAGFTEAVQLRLDTLRAIEQADANADPDAYDQATGTDREAG